MRIIVHLHHVLVTVLLSTTLSGFAVAKGSKKMHPEQ